MWSRKIRVIMWKAGLLFTVHWSLVTGLGCAGRTSSLLLERQARGPIAEEPTVARPLIRQLEPATQTLAKGAIEVTVMFATPQYLIQLFSNKAIFGPYAGMNPYFPEHLVFYVKVANRSEKKLQLVPSEFVLIDDRGNQYHTIGADYITAFAEYRAPVATTTRGVLEGASPGYFGLSVPVGRMIAGKPQGRFALLQQSALQSGYLYPGVVHDGLIAFWNPAREAKTLRLLVTNIKTDFDAMDQPKTSLEFPFDFTVTSP